MPELTPAEMALDPLSTDETSENARNGAAKRRDPKEPTAVVGLGASAGGIAVLQQFFSDMSPESGLAFVVVMHLAAEYESNLAPILQARTSMPVTQVTEPVQVQPNHVYVIPPNHQLAFENGLLQLTPPQQAMGKRVTIDLFFRTLAQGFGQRAVCIVLSGTDSDGAIGVKHIRGQGGLAIAQDPSEAEHDSMPRTAIGTGMVDWVLPVSKMPAKLLEFVKNEHGMRLPPEILETTEPDVKEREAPGGETVSDEARSPEDESALSEVLAHLRAHTGHDFTHYKRATLLRRIARRLQVNSIETIPHYLEFMRLHPAEVRALLQDLLIGVTHFFRDQESFAALEASIPQIFAGKHKDDQVRLWVAGCATGEEAYSIAMLLCEHAERLETPPSIQVFATDIDEQAIADARDGLYPSTIEADVSQERLRRFFSKDHGRYRVRKSLREKVLFASHNVLSDAPFSRLDLVSCRNLLIYLNGKAQEQVFDIFHFALRSGGLLFIGGSESTTVQGLFSPVDGKHRIYVRRSIPRPTWKMPVLPLRTADATGRIKPAGRVRPLPPCAVKTAGESSDDAQITGQERRAALFGELHLKLLEQYAPPSIVVNEQHEIVHLSGEAGRYLRLAAGEPSANLFKLVRPELQIELRTALFRAGQGGEHNVTGAPQTIHSDGRSEAIEVQVRRVQSSPGETFFLVLFRPTTDQTLSLAQTVDGGDAARVLADEIQHLKEQLAATVEQHEASNEELKAANEELQAMNEEMRSATEELETSKEELQSLNEELSTVKSELKSSVDDLCRTNTDLTNLMSSTDIGTVFLDRQLRIHRFTPSAQKVFNLLPADLGRPVSDITYKLGYKGLIADCEQVLEDLATIEREVPMDERDVSSGAKRWYLLRIAPYRTVEDRIAGVVATFIDISRRKCAEDDLRELHRRAEVQAQKFKTIMAGVPDFLYQFDLQGRFSYISQSLLDLWQKTNEEAIGRNFDELDYPPELAAKLQRQIEAVVATGQTLKVETPFTSAFGARIYEYIFFPLRASNGGVEGVGGVTRDITERRQADEALRESEARIATNLAGMRRLYELQGKLANQTDVKVALADVLALACEFTGTDRGCVQLLSADGERLEMFVWQGYADDSPFVSFFRYEGVEVARVERQRMIIEDTVGFPALEGTAAGAAVRADGIRAAQSTPMASRAGETIGVISTQFPQPHRPSDHELRLMDMVAWTAAEFLERYRADAALRESEARFRSMFEQASVGIVQIGEGGRFLAANRGFAEFSGYSESELKQMQVRDVSDSAGYPDEEELTRRLTNGEIPEYTLDKRYVRKDGCVVWATMTATFVRRTSGEPLYTLAIIQPIGDRKRAEEELSASEERFRQFAENSADVFWIVDAATLNLEYLNPVFEQMWGVPRETLLHDTQRFYDFVHPEDRELAGTAQRCALAGKREVIEYRIIRPSDGSERWIRDTGFPIPDENGDIARVAGVAQDVTEDKNRTEAIRRAEERFRFLVEGTPDYAMFLMDAGSKITFWSSGAERVFGWTAEEAQGRTGDLIFTLEDRQEGAVEKEIATALDQGFASDRRWHLRKDGSRLWIDGIMRRIDHPDGSHRGFAKIGRDASDQRDIEDQLRHARDEMEQRVDDRTRDLLSTNNELERTMLQRQQLEKELLEISEREKRRIGEDLHDSVCQELTATALFLKSSATAVRAESASAAEMLIEAAEIVNRNVGMTRDMARGLQPADLKGAGLKEALRALATQACENTELRCHFKAARGVRVQDDSVALHLYRVAQEAVTNAVKHAEAKNILIALDRNPEHICVSVQDDGKGFSPTRRSKGLGLHIMRYRANALGGKLKIEKRKSGGMDITCVIPVKQ